MKYKKGQSGNPKGKPKGAKSKVCETFYEYAQRALHDDRVGGYEGFVGWIIKCARNREIYFSWLAKWAEKQIKEEKVVDLTGQHKLLIEIINTKPE